MNIAESLSYGRSVLRNPLEAEVLLSFLLKKSREFLIMYPEGLVAKKTFERFKMFARKRGEGEPLAYILNQSEFYKIPLHIDERCFIPRPETELLVDLILERIKKGDAILDLGTGSGAIAIAIAKNCPDVKIIASDISEKTLEVAKINIKKYGLKNRIKLVKSNLLENLYNYTFTGIVANLPYISRTGFSFAEQSVEKFEPVKALFGGRDGLIFYRRLLKQIASLRKTPYFVIGEFGFNQSDSATKMLKDFISQSKESWEFSIHNDFAAIPRAFLIKKL